MQKEYVEIKIPIFDDANEIEIVKTFNEQQLYYVCALAKAFENSKNEKQQLISFLENEIKKYKDNSNKKITVESLSEDTFGIEKKIEAFQKVLDFVNKGGKDE